MSDTATGPQAHAKARYVRVAPDKARQVVRHIRGLPVSEARNVLLLSPKEVSRQLVKILDSAIANGENNHGLDLDDLVVTLATVDEGPTLRRFQARAMGRAYRIRKRTSHITIVVAERARRRKVAATEPERRRGRRGPKQEPASEAPAKDQDQDQDKRAAEAADEAAESAVDTEVDQSDEPDVDETAAEDKE